MDHKCRGINYVNMMHYPEDESPQLFIKYPHMLVFAAGFPPVYGKQILYFLDKIFSERSKIDAPEKSDNLSLSS